MSSLRVMSCSLLQAPHHFGGRRSHRSGARFVVIKCESRKSHGPDSRRRVLILEKELRNADKTCLCGRETLACLLHLLNAAAATSSSIRLGSCPRCDPRSARLAGGLPRRSVRGSRATGVAQTDLVMT